MKKINFERFMYNNISKLAYYDDLENLMLIGADYDGEFINAKSSTFKWFTQSELKEQTAESAVVSEQTMAKSIKEILNRGADAIIMIHTHPCKTKEEDWLYASLSDEDFTASKNVELMCNLQNLDYYAGVATCEGLYFWQLDNKSLKPIQMECYVDGENVTRKVPTTLEEIVRKLQN